jgi:hypothetical protein
MDLKDWKRYAYILVIIGCAQFIILTLVAMLFYGGGSYYHPYNPGYDFINNYFSDLGLTKSYNGKSNMISSVLFAIAACGAGISMFPFFLAFPSYFTKKSWIAKYSSIIGSLIGIFAAICYIGIGLTPYDLYLSEHYFFVYSAFTSALFMVIAYSIAMVLNKDYPKKYAIVFICFGIVLFAYVMLLFFGPTWETQAGLLIQVVGQKVIVYLMISTLLVQGYGALKLYNTANKT